jgi:hypothetical protein
MNERDILFQLIEAAGQSNCLSTDMLDSILKNAWGNDYDAGMHCNSMMRRGLIDCIEDGDWEICITREELEEEDA